MKLLFNERVEAISRDTIKLQSGKEVPASAVVMAVGVQPETTLAAEAGLAIGKTGGIRVNANF